MAQVIQQELAVNGRFKNLVVARSMRLEVSSICLLLEEVDSNASAGTPCLFYLSPSVVFVTLSLESSANGILLLRVNNSSSIILLSRLCLI